MDRSQHSETCSVPLLDLKQQYAAIREEIKSAIERVIETQNFILGPEVLALEQEIAAYCQCRHAVGVSSGTDALLVSLMAIGIGPGDKVITTPYTFFATAGCLARLGAKPVFVDIDPCTYNIDVHKIEAAISPRTKAILPVHLFGQMADMDAILDIARAHKLWVIEDAAQAIGAEQHGRRAGSIGHLGCFSFFPSKNLGAYGDGGMVTTNDPELAERVKILRGHGSQPKYYHKFVGGNFRLDALQAAVLRVKFKYLDSWTAARQQNAARYRRLFTAAGLATVALSESMPKSENTLILPQESVDRRDIYNQFVIRVKNDERDRLASYLQGQRIGTEIYYPVALHLQECFADLGYRVGDLPESESAAAGTLALPIYPEITESMQSAVVDRIGEFFRSERNF